MSCDGLAGVMSAHDPHEAAAAAEQLESARHEVLRLREDIEEVCDRIRAIARCAWSGPAAEAWRARLGDLGVEGQSALDDLDRLGADLRTAADRAGKG